MPVATGVVRDLGMAARCILAACDMPAERCRATALDRTHHLQLLEAHMGAIGLTPSRAVIAEDVRDLQSWEPWPAVLRCRLLLIVWLRTPAARRVQTLQGALDLGNQSDRHATIAGCRLGLGMSEHGLNDTKALAALEQVGREGVAKRMQRNRLAQPRGFGGLLEQSTELTRGQWLMLTAAWEQQAVFGRNAVVGRGRPRLPPLPQQLQQLRRQHHVPVLAALRLHDADDHLLAVDVTRPQPHHLAGPQPATIGQR